MICAALKTRHLKRESLVLHLYHMEHGHKCDLTIVLKKHSTESGYFGIIFTRRKLSYHMVSVKLVNLGPYGLTFFLGGGGGGSTLYNALY